MARVDPVTCAGALDPVDFLTDGTLDPRPARPGGFICGYPIDEHAATQVQGHTNSTLLLPLKGISRIADNLCA